jgi:ferredoxin
MSQKVTRVWLDETENECTMCGACEATCPEVFEVPEKMIVVEKPDLSITDVIEEAAEGCPVGTIAIEFDNSGKRDNPF